MGWYRPPAVPLALALFYGVLQGATELFPVSSLGHAVVIPALLQLSVRSDSPIFVPFLTLLHLGTAGALLVLYRGEWVRIVRGFVRAAIRGRVDGPDERLALLLVAGTVPAGVVGFLLEKPLKQLFASPRLAATFLVINGALLFGAELLRRRDERRRLRGRTDRLAEEHEYAGLESLSVRGALLIGGCQVLALLPGISRSGVTLAGGLVAGLRHTEALHFSFLLATPVILAAGLLEVPQLAGAPDIGNLVLGAVVAGLAAYASARFLVRYFRVGRLDPYAAYCAVLGVAALVIVR
jgi:undecaprenyl-diphosphatase